MKQIVLTELGEADLPSIEAVFDSCEDYFILTTGGPAAPAAAFSLFVGLPEGKSYEDKHVFGVCDAETSELVGVIDAIAGYPEPGGVMLGLFLVVPEYRRRGVREKACALLEQWSREQGAKAIRTGVYEVDEEGVKFWEAAGFRATGQTSWDRTRKVVVFEKFLSE